MMLRTFLADIKFEHSVFALPFAYGGLFLAEGGWPKLSIFLWVTVAMVSFRTFAMAANRLIDAKIDAQNPRTARRALPSGRLAPPFVTSAALISLLIFATSAWILRPICFFLSPLPIFLAWLYPYLKRFTWLSHFVLGILLGIAPYGAWLASRGEFSWIPGLFWIGVASWVAGFDIFYSLQDIEVDQAQGLSSIPARFGTEKARVLAGLFHGVALGAWAGAGALAGLQGVYAGGLLLVTLFLVREHWLVHRFGLARMNQAFFTSNAWVSVMIFAAVAADVLW